MEIFEEVKNRYFHIVFKLLNECKGGLMKKDILRIIHEEEFQEKVIARDQKTFSGLLLNSYEEDNYNLLKKDGDSYYAVLENNHNSTIPVRFTSIEKEWLKALIEDSRVKLMLGEETLNKLSKELKDVDTPISSELIDYTNVSTPSDTVDMQLYEKNFKLILKAIVKEKPIRYCNTDKKGNRYCNCVSLPLRLEYSMRDGRFRVSMHSMQENRPVMATIATMNNIEILEKDNLEITRKGAIKAIRGGRYSKEPVILEVCDKKMAMERCFMSFSSMERSARRIGEDKYEIKLNYYVFEEEDLIRKILALGPYVRVVSPQRIIHEVVERINRALQFNKAPNL